MIRSRMCSGVADGERTLSVILSKAFLLAADDRIADPTISRQIERGRRNEAAPGYTH